MTTIQKIIKGLAIALAVFIIFNIVSAIASVFFAITGINWAFDTFTSNEEVISSVENTFDIEEIKNIKIKSGIEKIEIIPGNEFKVIGENVPESFSCNVENETLNITSSGKAKFFWGNDSIIKVYIPKEFVFENANLSLGVGETNIENLLVEYLDLTCGAGEIDIKYIEARKGAKINCGVGEFTIKDSKLNNLEFNAGVGENEISSVLSGKCTLKQGVGESNIILKDFDEENGKINTKKGIGELRVNGKEYSGNQTFGIGEDVIVDVFGGVGEVRIKY